MLIKAAFSVPSKIKEDKTEQNCSKWQILWFTVFYPLLF